MSRLSRVVCIALTLCSLSAFGKESLVFRTEWSHDAQSVTFKRSLAIRTLSVGREHYPQIRSFYKRVSTADQDNVILKKAAK